MSRYLPIMLAVVAIVGLTVVQSLMSDRFVDSNVTAHQRAELLAKVPKDFGDWKGKDLEVTEDVRSTAGAVGAVSRLYENTRTGEVARLWLIVGHARDISAHTPDVCFKGSGFSMRAATSSLYPFVGEGIDHEAKFWTNTFTKEDALAGRQLERVFWAWYNPVSGEPVAWRAETNPRWTFGNTRALYKMYFTSQMKDINETTEDSPAQRFGKEFLPIINQVLSNSDIRAEGDSAVAAAEAPATPDE